jgi:Secretion system C-terminal sorting domain
MEGGDTLVPLNYYLNQSSTSFGSQGSIILPMDNHKYYCITTTMSDVRFAECNQNTNCYFDLLLYHVIDMAANNGLGKVVRPSVSLLQNANLRKTQMMACRHSNGKDWWLLNQEGDYGNVHVTLFTQDSVYDKGIQLLYALNWGVWDIRGMSTFNNDGSRYATTSHGSSTGLIMLGNFDRCYGEVKNTKVIEMPAGSQHIPSDTTIMERLSVGLAFSPNNKYLYVISMSNIYQYDFIDDTWFHIAGIDTDYTYFTKYETCYLGPDGKLYIGNSHGTSKQMSIINNPNDKGSACNFCPRCLRLDSLGTNAYVGTPPCMPDYNLGAKTCFPLSTPNMLNSLGSLSVYPNPVMDELHIQYFEKENTELDLLDMTGRIVKRKTLLASDKKGSIDMNDLSTGIYTYEHRNAAGEILHKGKIVKQ